MYIYIYILYILYKLSIFIQQTRGCIEQTEQMSGYEFPAGQFAVSEGSEGNGAIGAGFIILDARVPATPP
jgi:hypothetical protein